MYDICSLYSSSCYTGLYTCTRYGIRSMILVRRSAGVVAVYVPSTACSIMSYSYKHAKVTTWLWLLFFLHQTSNRELHVETPLQLFVALVARFPPARKFLAVSSYCCSRSGCGGKARACRTVYPTQASHLRPTYSYSYSGVHGPYPVSYHTYDGNMMQVLLLLLLRSI